jgi:hypothetical protein
MYFLLKVILIVLFTAGIFSISYADSTKTDSSTSLSKGINSSYFLQKSKANITIFKRSNILFQSNIEINNDLRGEGSLILSSDKMISINAHSRKIINLSVYKNTRVQLTGHIQILRKFRVYDGAEIILGNFNLVLAPEIYFANFQQIFQNSLGQLICLSNTINDISNTNSTNFTPSTVGIFYLFAETSFFSQRTSLHAFCFKDSYLSFIMDTDTPPPKSV